MGKKAPQMKMPAANRSSSGLPQWAAGGIMSRGSFGKDLQGGSKKAPAHKPAHKAAHKPAKKGK